jgi:phenylacetate-coenzyme A ligase PaaK-like adenylate-forming protein
MPKVAPFHSTRPGEDRHHDNDQCTEGNNIERHYWASGTGGKPLCHRCKVLDEEGK